MKKKILLIAMITAIVCLTACSNKKESNKKEEKDITENNSESLTESIFYYNEGIDYNNNIIFNPDQKKFVKMENNTYIDLEQDYKEVHIKINDFEDDIKWYYCKEGNSIFYKQYFSDTEENGTHAIYIVTEKVSGDTYLLLCKNNTHTGYSWEYPVKFNIETGEYEDIFANATINGKDIKQYEYLKNWKITSNDVKVDCSEKLLEPESQTWKQEQVEIN